MKNLFASLTLLFHKFGSPRHFFRLSGLILPWAGGITVLLLATGLYYGLWVAPPDYQQGDSYRIMFIHVPAAWMSLFVYLIVALAAAITLVWKMKLAEVVLNASASIGAWFTALTLVTGSLWGKPMWGAWWVWDARLTFELILLFWYLGLIALNSAIENKDTAARATAVMALVGVINIPIIHYSVDLWNTMHQGSSVSLMKPPTMDINMFIPLLIMAFAFKFYYLTSLLMKIRGQVLMRERNSTWVQALIKEPT